MILGVLEIDWNFIDFLDHPKLRQDGQEVVKRIIPGGPPARQIAAGCNTARFQDIRLQALKDIVNMKSTS